MGKWGEGAEKGRLGLKLIHLFLDIRGFGTIGQGENVFQWGESACSGSNTNAADARGFRGGSWGGTSYVLRP